MIIVYIRKNKTFIIIIIIIISIFDNPFVTLAIYRL